MDKYDGLNHIINTNIISYGILKVLEIFRKMGRFQKAECN